MSNDAKILFVHVQKAGGISLFRALAIAVGKEKSLRFVDASEPNREKYLQMTEEEIEWYEDNWNRSKTGREAESHGRVWKLTNDIWDEPREGEMNSANFRNCKCWKKKRKDHYIVKKILKVKKRKPEEKEHWRQKRALYWWNYREISLGKLK